MYIYVRTASDGRAPLDTAKPAPPPLLHSTSLAVFFRYVCAEEQLPAWSAEVPGTPEQLSVACYSEVPGTPEQL